MLISLTKLLLFFLIVVLIASGFTYLLDSSNIILGEVQVTFADVEYILNPVQAVFFIIFLSIAIWFVLKFLSLLSSIFRFINGDDTALSQFFYRNRERKGYQALSDGMLALASGESNLAMEKASKAARFLNKPSLTNVLAAQAAELSGNRKKAQEIYKALFLLPETRFVGVRGLLKHKLEDGNTEVALQLAERAFSIKPKNEEIQDTLLQLQAKTEDWDGARKTLRAKLKHGNLPRDVHNRRDAVLALSQAKGVLEEGQNVEARENAIEANRLSPDLVPAATMAARSYIEQGKPKYAARVIQKAWEAQPHPDLATVFSEISSDETPSQRLKRFATLHNLAPSHRETKLAMAELYLAAEEFSEARKQIKSILDDDPDARIFTIMAAVERGQGGSDELVRGWLAKALSAQRGPQWTCENCQTAHPEWTPVCKNCEAFDTLTWKAPPVANITSSTGIEVLPLLTGRSGREKDLPGFSEPLTEASSVKDVPDEKEQSIKDD